MAKERWMEMHKENNERLANGRVPSQRTRWREARRRNERREDGEGEDLRERGGRFPKGQRSSGTLSTIHTYEAERQSS
jgi:hypothetical protein